MALLFSAGLAGAQEESASSPANPCQTQAHYHDFDFWLGSWDVYVGDVKAGENTISRQEKGCLLLEQWTDSAGGTGQSYNFYVPDSNEWRQVWVSEHIIIDYSGGLTEEGSMLLTGWMVYQKNRQRVEFRGTWTPMDDGTVRQHFEQYDAATDTWNALFTGIYHRRE